VLLLFRAIWFVTWPSWILISWLLFFSFFPKKYIYNVYEVTWFVRNVPLGVLKKCLYSGEVQCPAPWNLIELDIFTSFPEKLYSNFAGMFL
jgi:hypothetical protein